MQGTQVATVIGVGSPVTTFGCSEGSGDGSTAIDANGNAFTCIRTIGQPAGLIVSPYSQEMSNVHKLRVYSSKHYPRIDPVTYILEGRVDSSSPWELIGQGDFPWITDSTPGRNPTRTVMYSTYESGHSSFTYTEVTFPDNNKAYLEYKMTFEPRKSSETTIKFAEVELPGLLL